MEHRVNTMMPSHMTDKKLLASSAAKYMKTALFWGYYSTSCGNSLLTFRDNLSVLFSRVQNFGTDRFFRNVGKE